MKNPLSISPRPIALTILIAAMLWGMAVAGPIATITFTNGERHRYEIIGFDAVAFTLRETDGSKTIRVDAQGIQSIDYGSEPEIKTPAKPKPKPKPKPTQPDLKKSAEQLKMLRSALENNEYRKLRIRMAMMARTAKGRESVMAFGKELSAELKKADLSHERKRALRIAQVLVAGALDHHQQRIRLIRELVRDYGKDPAFRRFRKESLERGKGNRSGKRSFGGRE
jgi:hypothetical protein